MIRILQKEVSLQWLQTLNVPLMSSSSNHLMSSLAFWTSPVTQLVKNLPAVWETWVRSLGWEDPLEKGKHSGLENSMDRTVHGVTKSQTQLE